jgi:2-C-methyl-D-erythritol 2,4-cyclodiphosphate synthase
MRVGSGFDVHAFADGRRLVIGGVDIPHSRGLGGHSDADVLCHAIADAILGAAGLGDIGTMFPAEPQWEDASSLVLLATAAEAARDSGWKVRNVDATVIAEEPRLAPFTAEMAVNVARAVKVEIQVVSVKATTTDGLGFTGRREGMAAMATVLLEPAVGETP